MSAAPRLTAAVASGVALAFCFPPYSLSILAWVSLALLMAVSLGASSRSAFVYGFAHGAAFCVISMPWAYTVMRVYGNLSVIEAAGVFAAFAATISLFPAIFSLCLARLGRLSVSTACVAAPFLWVALEFARTHLPSHGFPWNLLGYAGARHLGLLQLASVTGIYGLSFVLAGVNAFAAWLFLARPRHPWLVGSVTGGILLSAVLVGDQFVPQEAPDRVAALVQTNFPQAPEYPADWFQRHAADLDEIERLSADPAKPRPSVIIWPEVPAPFYWQDPRFSARLSRVAQTAGNHILTGVVDWKLPPGTSSGRLEPYNTAILVDPAGRRVFSYDKIHLVPFGEYVPLRRWLSFADKLTVEVGEFQPGSSYAVGDLPGGSFGVFICYEAVYPDEVRQFVKNGARLLINISNDGWLQNSGGGEQHLAMALVRAAENRRWLLRATNTGVTASIDPYGRIVARFTPEVRGLFRAPYGYRKDLTLYARWGDWFAWFCVAAAVTSLLGSVFRRKES
jgi:apolipoprotein N-acyltransferase